MHPAIVIIIVISALFLLRITYLNNRRQNEADENIKKTQENMIRKEDERLRNKLGIKIGEEKQQELNTKNNNELRKKSIENNKRISALVFFIISAIFIIIIAFLSK